MNVKQRMSPWTAAFIGLFGIGAVGIAAGTSIVLYTLRIADSNVSEVFGLVENTFEGLPELVDSLPASVRGLLNDRRRPEYAANLKLVVNFLPDDGGRGPRPALTITNNGDEVISLLAVRVAALNADRVPVTEWTEVVATPLAFDDEWRGPLMPHATRYVVLSDHRAHRVGQYDGNLTGVCEVSDIRIWRGEDNTAVALVPRVPHP